MNHKFVVLPALLLAVVFAQTACGGGNGDSGIIYSGASGGSSEADAGADATTPAENVGEIYALYKAAVEKLLTADGYECDISVNTYFDGESAEADSSMTGHIMVNDPTGNVEKKTVIVTQTAGNTLELTYYVKDGYQYTESFGNKMKTTLEVDDVSSTTGALPEFEEAEIGTAGLSDVNGSTVVILYINGLEISATIDGSGNLTELVQKSTSSLDGVEATSVTTLNHIQPGRVEIDFPDDLDTYEEWLSGEVSDSGLVGIEIDTD
ncbi:MAG: hypothetical protein LBR44_01585 [Clostridiales Family XIII bacterium]|jgi:hypothetical protein|nr:hypothetical protein [Clostridiales Family XIII bacterium]